MMPLEVEVQVESDSGEIPSGSDIRHWIAAAIGSRRADTELTVRVVDEAESAALNKRFRNNTNATNVLSFPAEIPAPVGSALLGDIVICAPVVKSEAMVRNRPAKAHWAHLVVHGALHLLGFDHETENQAREMETEETAILAGLGFSDPYAL